jgi:toxin HigB-1
VHSGSFCAQRSQQLFLCTTGLFVHSGSFCAKWPQGNLPSSSFGASIRLCAPLAARPLRAGQVFVTNYLPLTLVTQFGSMIISFGSRDTEKIWYGHRVGKISLTIQEIGRRKLRMINNAVDLADLRIPPANRLEKLSGDLRSFYSIRINDQWRIIFKWNAGNASEVKIVDYH